MLKRYQIMMDDWLMDYLKQSSEKYGLSFSEIIRLLVSINVCRLIKTAHFETEEDLLEDKEIIDALNKRLEGKMGKEEFNKKASKIYFETRKLIEKRLVLRK